MAIKVVYPNPTVKEVLFQITFPSFFGMEGVIGDYQMKILDRLPKSSILLKNHFQIINYIAVPNPEKKENQGLTKIWQFRSDDDSIILNITNNSFDITSKKHKTYNNSTSDQKFRDLIESFVNAFLTILPFPTITRMGLRYIDSCPVPNPLNNDTFYSYYNTNVNLTNESDISKIKEFHLRTSHNRGDIDIITQEMFVINPIDYILDFDGVAFNVPRIEYLATLDRIHHEISNFFENMIKQPVIDIMNNTNESE